MEIDLYFASDYFLNLLALGLEFRTKQETNEYSKITK